LTVCHRGIERLRIFGTKTNSSFPLPVKKNKFLSHEKI
jgi:hypothetical protein